MMPLKLKKSTLEPGLQIDITGSKSESNRLLILQALIPGIELENLSNADDVKLMQKALASNSEVVDIHHAGTAMRFLTAYFASSNGREVVLTGSSRMKQRPIKILVEALQQLGAQIEYLENPGYPPLKIHGQTFSSNQVELKADVSSQYITALMLIGCRLPNGLEIRLTSTPTSLPYIQMTKGLLKRAGISCSFQDNMITVKPFTTFHDGLTMKVESDWSSASYYYSFVALSKTGTRIALTTFNKDSLQGDSALKTIYKEFGVDSTFEDGLLYLEKVKDSASEKLVLDLVNTPDIAQTIAVTCLALNRACFLKGLHTLKIKETDRLMALKQEMEKFGGSVHITDHSLRLDPPDALGVDQLVETYNDHRMAMAFAPLSLVTDLFIKDHEVVSKSYPDFWSDLAKLGIQIGEI